MGVQKILEGMEEAMLELERQQAEAAEAPEQGRSAARQAQYDRASEGLGAIEKTAMALGIWTQWYDVRGCVIMRLQADAAEATRA